MDLSLMNLWLDRACSMAGQHWMQNKKSLLHQVWQLRTSFSCACYFATIEEGSGTTLVPCMSG